MYRYVKNISTLPLLLWSEQLLIDDDDDDDDDKWRLYDQMSQKDQQQSTWQFSTQGISNKTLLPVASVFEWGISYVAINIGRSIVLAKISGREKCPGAVLGWGQVHRQPKCWQTPNFYSQFYEEMPPFMPYFCTEKYERWGKAA